LLACGGAYVYTLKLPVKNIAKVADTLTYIFVNNKTAANLLHLVEYGVLCLRPEYIGDYLIKVSHHGVLCLRPEYIGDYLIKVSHHGILCLKFLFSVNKQSI
jgi:hypothetical protein